jgi:hypothetical protein
MPYFVEAYADDCKVSATGWTAKEAFALAVEWRIVKRLSAVSISHDSNSYSIAEFASAMALQEIADTGRGVEDKLKSPPPDAVTFY